MKKASPLRNPRSQSDAAWKFILERYFQPFLAFFYPDLEVHIDWTQPIETLDKELQQITTAAMVGKRAVDMLFKVRLKTGEEAVILLHVDVQNSEEAHFPERMYVYNYLIYNLRKLPVMTLVILADDRPTWRPAQYTSEILGYTVTTFNFRTVKLLDWQGREKELLTQENPFAWAVAVHLAAQKTQRDPPERLALKLALTRRLYERGFSRDEILNFYTFLDRLLKLPTSLEIRYNEGIDQLEAEKQMQIITGMEQRGIQKGLHQGLHQGKLESAKRLLLKGLDLTFLKEALQLTEADLKELED